MLPDYHLHTSRCGHATGETGEYLVSAAAAGMTEVGFADHIYMYWLPVERRDPSLAMREEELPLYFRQIKEIKFSCPGLSVKCGLEVDFVPGSEKELAGVLTSYPFDYIIGSVHYIDGWGFDNPSLIDGYRSMDVAEIYRRYFDLLGQAAKSGLFDIMAHPDLVKKFGFRPEEDLLPLYRETIKTFSLAGVCVEVNTAGLRAPVGEIYPDLIFLQLCKEYGIPVTTGSDAHRPDQVGAGFPEAKTLLKIAGYNEVAVFENRNISFIKI